MIKMIMGRVIKYVLLRHIIPILTKELDYFAKNVVHSKGNTVNHFDIEDVANIAKEHFIDRLEKDILEGEFFD